MKQSGKIVLLVIMLAGIFVFAAGCDKINFRFFNASEENTVSDSTADEDNQNKKDIESNTSSDTDTLTQTTDETDSTPSTEETTPTAAAIQPVANIDLPIYTVDAEKGVVIPVTAVIPEGSGITKELIVENVVNALADQSIIIDVIDVAEQDDAVIVNFSSENPPYKNMGSGYEAAILDAIAQSLIDNLDQYNKVIFHVDGGAYISGVYEYGVDEPYFTR